MCIHEKIKIFFNKLKNSNLKIAIFGDSIVDEYYKVDSTRISPEFPIPVNLTSNDKPDTVLPGGAGNVCRQFSNFVNIHVEYFSLIDNYAKEIYEKNNIKTDLCITIPEPSRVPIKKRFYNNQIPLFRWDVEKKNFGLSNIECYQQELFEFFNNNSSDVCIFSDYSKGVFNKKINYSHSRSIVDSKNIINCECDIFKPNKLEAMFLTSTENQKDQCLILKNKMRCKNVLITDSYKGFYGINSKNEFFEFNSKKEKCQANVIGGGDCYIAYLSIATQLGFDLYDSAEIAFYISYFYVTSNNNKNLNFIDFYCLFNEKIVDKEDLVKRDFKLIFTNGCFDAGLTPGHVECLKFAKNQGGKVVVALNSDDSVSRIKGKNRPILSLSERMKIISSLSFVDFVVSFEQDTPEALIKQLMPEVIVKGGDYKPEEVVGKNFSDVLICPHINSISTTKKIELIND